MDRVARRFSDRLRLVVAGLLVGALAAGCGAAAVGIHDPAIGERSGSRPVPTAATPGRLSSLTIGTRQLVLDHFIGAGGRREF